MKRAKQSATDTFTIHQSHYAVQCEALDGTPLPAPLCKLLRLPQGTKWGRHEGVAAPAPPAPAPVQAREEEC